MSEVLKITALILSFVRFGVTPLPNLRMFHKPTSDSSHHSFKFFSPKNGKIPKTSSYHKYIVIWSFHSIRSSSTSMANRRRHTALITSRGKGTAPRPTAPLSLGYRAPPPEKLRSRLGLLDIPTGWNLLSLHLEALSRPWKHLFPASQLPFSLSDHPEFRY